MEGLSVALLTFLRERISSYEELEVLLALARRPGTSWSVSEIADTLRMPRDACEAALSRLAAQDGLLITTTTGGIARVGFAPQTESLATLVAELGAAYMEQRLAIVRVMSANALDRVRGAAARRLAEGFRIERPKK